MWKSSSCCFKVFPFFSTSYLLFHISSLGEILENNVSSILQNAFKVRSSEYCKAQPCYVLLLPNSYSFDAQWTQRCCRIPALAKCFYRSPNNFLLPWFSTKAFLQRQVKLGSLTTFLLVLRCRLFWKNCFSGLRFKEKLHSPAESKVS